MKKAILIFLISCFGVNSFAQLALGDQPTTWKNDRINWQSQVLKMQPFDVAEMMAEDAINNEYKDTPYRFGKKFTLGKNLDNSGEWNYLPSGDRIWILEIESENAISLNVGFDLFYIPEGAYMFVYNADKSEVIRKFDHLDNNIDEMFGIWPIFGDRIIVEYYEPVDVIGQSKLQLEYVTHAYRDLLKMANGAGDSGSCNNNVVCPESAGWENEINSVAMIIAGGNGVCTGSLINNVLEDGHPYFLTANHCLGGSVGAWVFRFNWQSTTCSGSSDPGGPYYEINGATLLASGESSDYALLELNPIPSSYNVYFAGWDATGATPTSSVGIHHPRGDLKKISFDNDPAVSSTFGGAATWEITNWEDGTTEPASSGSPQFDQNHRIVGQLYGGTAACGNDQDDQYGKFSVTYPNICEWLNPGCGAIVLDGLDPNDLFNSDDDAGIQFISEPTGTSCTTTIDPVVILKNYGLNTLTSVTINYENIGGNTGSYSWTGSLASGASVSVSLPALATSPGAYSFYATTDSPNGVLDQDASNDEATTSHTVVVGSVVSLQIDTDCYGEETSWIIQDYAGTIIDQISPNTLGNQITFNWDICLAGGCYDLIINDSFGDGLNASAFGCPEFGNYQLVDEIGNVLVQMENPDFGSSVTHNFCLPSTDGCTEPSACNYNPLVITDDGSCTYPGCTDANACNYNSLAVCSDSSCAYPGCDDAAACNYDSTAGCNDGSCLVDDACGNCGGTATSGCMDSNACNYDSTATCDDGSCLLPDGCLNISACNYDSSASCDDGSCEYLTCRGCTGEMACNYDFSASIDDGSCEYISCGGCMAENACNYDPSASIDDGSCEYTSCTGCTYPGSPEHDPMALLDDGSCTFEIGSPCPGDFNDDGEINASDLLTFLGVFGDICE